MGFNSAFKGLITWKFSGTHTFVKTIKVQTDVAIPDQGWLIINRAKLEVFTNKASLHSRYTTQTFHLSRRDVLICWLCQKCSVNKINPQVECTQIMLNGIRRH